MVYDFTTRLADLLFPPTCILCNQPGSGGIDLCSGCQAGFRKNGHACIRCALPLTADAPPGSLCGQCTRRKPPFDTLRAPWLYHGNTAELIRLLKFQRKLAADRTLGLLLAQALKSERKMPQLLLPVPLHSQQLRERGFNHAAEITRSLSRALEIPWSTRHLSKRHPTAPQHGLNRRERLKNLRNAFHFQQNGDLRHVAIVDDVVTTGSTATEIARLLKRAGVEKVSIWAVAGPRWSRPRATSSNLGQDGHLLGKPP